jgi:sirohydrochlorin ferrochelatase
LGIANGRVTAAFIDQNPTLAAATGFGANAICLPFFAAAGGHVLDDIPRDLAAAGFAGRILPPLGLHPNVPQAIADAISAARPVCSVQCRYTLNAGQI